MARGKDVSMGAGWRLWLGLILEVLGILVATFSIGTGIMLLGLALGVLTVIVGLIQVTFWSRGSPRVVVTRRRLSLQNSYKNVIARSTSNTICHAAAALEAFLKGHAGEHAHLPA